MSDVPAYGLWSLVFINSLIFIVFALSFTHLKTSRDWIFASTKYEYLRQYILYLINFKKKKGKVHGIIFKNGNSI